MEKNWVGVVEGEIIKHESFGRFKDSPGAVGSLRPFLHNHRGKKTIRDPGRLYLTPKTYRCG
jgi:hypothetical protein